MLTLIPFVPFMFVFVVPGRAWYEKVNEKETIRTNRLTDDLRQATAVKVPHSASEVLTFLAIERELYHILIRRALMAMLVQADVRWYGWRLCGIGLFFAIAVNSDGGLDASSSASSFCYSKLSLNSSSVLLFGAVPLLSRCITHIIDLRSQRRGKEVCGKIGHDRSWMRKRSTKFGCFFQSQ